MSQNQLKAAKQFDMPLIAASLALVIIGLVTIYDASVVSAFRDFGDKFYYFKNQLLWALLGLISLVFFNFFNYHKLLKASLFLLPICSLLLIAVLIPGVGDQIYGARRWISVGSFNFQPSEITKLALIFYLANIISKFENFKIRTSDAAIVYFLPIFVVTVLVLVEPDLGTSMIYVAIALVIYFVGRAPLWHFALSLPFIITGVVAAIVTKPYRLERLRSFIDPSYDPQGASYQINQILTALAQGGLTGVGIGASRAKFAFIPEVHSDSIFAIFIEELGLVGALFLMAIFLFLIQRAITIAQSSRDFQGKVLAIGLAALLASQFVFNLASIVALIPLTGVPLPFISYGGSSLLVTMTAIGILANIKRSNEND